MAVVEDDGIEKEFMLRGLRYAHHADDKTWQEFLNTAFRGEPHKQPKPKTEEVDPQVARANWSRLARGLRGRKGKRRK